MAQLAETSQEAFEELRRCAGSQFDPELVEYFIEAMQARDENRRTTPLTESQAKALAIGLEIEKLGAAMEAQDISQLATVAERLIAHATHLGFSEIVELACDISQSTGPDANLIQLMEQTTELIELCRVQQSSFLTTADRESTGVLES